MKTIKENLFRKIRAFTLIELLVVIAIIAVLAALMIPLAAGALLKQRINRAMTEMAQLDTAIDSYKAARGHFPPDNPNNYARPQLFYELTGTYFQQRNPPRTFVRLKGIDQLPQATVQAAFGVDGFVNTSLTENVNPEALKQLEVRDFFSTLKNSQFLGTNYNGVTVYFIGLPMDGLNEILSPEGRRLTPWHYNSSNPTNNPESFDLWVDIILRGKTNRICNWSATPIVL
ncbi:MAG TPA: type II secretion system protein [Verrucomicrobiota bacterium]|nr:type II secretion system protein [Verrucomicrobiota bacterium]